MGNPVSSGNTKGFISSECPVQSLVLSNLQHHMHWTQSPMYSNIAGPMDSMKIVRIKAKSRLKRPGLNRCYCANNTHCLFYPRASLCQKVANTCSSTLTQAACRSRCVETALSSTEALKKMLPRTMQWILRLGPLGIALIRSQVRALAKKYPKEFNEEELKASLGKIRTGIKASSSGYLVGDSISFAGVFSGHVLL